MVAGVWRACARCLRAGSCGELLFTAKLCTRRGRAAGADSKLWDRYLPPLRAVLLTFNPLPTFAHPAATFPLSASPFPPPTSSRPHDPTRLLKSPGPDDDDDEPEAPTTVQLISLPMIAGSGFALPTVQFEGLAWRPRIGQRIGWFS